MPPTERPKPRKRNRKRKRRNVSSSSSSTGSSSSSEDHKPQIAAQEPVVPVPVGGDSEDSDSSSSTSSGSSPRGSKQVDTKSKEQPRRRTHSQSPPPRNVDLPSFHPSTTVGEENEKEKALKEKFRKFWMASVADEFKDDLEEIRKEPNLSTSRLSLLIDSLASGAEVYSMSAQTSGSEVNEMELVLGAT